MNLKNKLLEVLRAEKNSTANRLGETGLIIFSHYIKCLPLDNPERKEIENQIINIAKNINQLTSEELVSLFAFMYITKVYVNEFAKITFNFEREKKINDPGMQAEIVRFLSSYYHLYSTEDLLRKKEMKEKHFWYWIDALKEINPALAVEFITENLSSGHNNDTVIPLLARMHFLKKRLTKECFIYTIEKWSSMFSEEDGQKIIRWRDSILRRDKSN